MGGGERKNTLDAMNYTISVSQRAQKEIAEAFLWYEDKQVGLGKKLLQLFDDKIAILQKNPNQYPAVHKSIRRALIKKFPYSIFYTVDSERIEILAFFHLKRNPIRWIERK